MCSCQQHSPNASENAATVASDALAFKVEDMTCGHCAGTVKKAIEAGIPGTVVEADPATKIVSVRGKRRFRSGSSPS